MNKAAFQWSDGSFMMYFFNVWNVCTMQATSLPMLVSLSHTHAHTHTLTFTYTFTYKYTGTFHHHHYHRWLLSGKQYVYFPYICFLTYTRTSNIYTWKHQCTYLYIHKHKWVIAFHITYLYIHKQCNVALFKFITNCIIFYLCVIATFFAFFMQYIFLNFKIVYWCWI